MELHLNKVRENKNKLRELKTQEIIIVTAFEVFCVSLIISPPVDNHYTEFVFIILMLFFLIVWICLMSFYLW